MTERLCAYLGEQVDGGSLAVFRVVLGLVLVAVPLRMVAYGWVDELYLQPSYHFAWVWWAQVPGEVTLYALFFALMGFGAAVAMGVSTRLAALYYLMLFLYVELLDAAYYLNHYVLLTLLLGCVAVSPAADRWSLDRRWGRSAKDRVPRWSVWLLRAVVGSVYVWAGLCKLQPDWLLRGEPLHTWLLARQDLPVVGEVLALRSTAIAMSWGGALYDLTVPFLLLHPRTRRVGVVLLVGFHAITGLLFPIGVFPWLMVGASVVFMPPSLWRESLALPGRISRARLGALGVVALLLLLVPARFLLYPGQVLWTEQGYRFAWRVLLIEKTGQVDFRVVDNTTGETWRVRPSTELTELQHKQMRTQPDLILQYARHLADQHAVPGHHISVYADSYASLNGRPAQRLVREDVDLAALEAGWDPYAWIVPPLD